MRLSFVLFLFGCKEVIFFMRMMLVGSGAVGECIVEMLVKRDPKREWFEYCLLCDIDINHAKEVFDDLSDDRCEYTYLDATNKEMMKQLISANNITMVMDASSPFCANYVFDAAFEAKVDYANMGTWSVPMKNPKYGLGIENSYVEPMTKYNFDRSEEWEKQGNQALICLGIDPGVVNIFARYLCEYEFDEVTELHVRDGGNLEIENADADDIVFGFNVWTVLDEVMNPNVEFDQTKGGFIVEKAFAGEETMLMPKVGMNTFVKVEHEEVVTMAKYLSKYGVKKCTFKISLDENLINALKVLDKLNLNRIEPIEIKGNKVIPRDVIAACAPQPKNIKDEMKGAMCVGVLAKGIKDNKEKSLMMYQYYSNEDAMKQFGLQAVVAQTGFGAALALELYAKGIYRKKGVHSLEAFDPIPFLNLMKETNFDFSLEDYTNIL